MREPLAAGTHVEGQIDWERRFDHTQQHSGQHLLSAIIWQELQAPTISFHLGESTSTINLSGGPITPHGLESVERIAHEILGEDRPVTSGYVSRAEAEAMLAAGQLRKLPDRQGSFRLIDIADCDKNACGGTHVRSTGQIGGLLVRSVEKVSRGVRIEFVCGLRAVRSARADFAILHKASALLSTGAAELAPTVERLLTDRHYQQLMAECDREIEQLMQRLDGKSDPRQNRPTPPANSGKQKHRKNQFYFEMAPELHRIFGVDLTAIPGISALTAHIVLAEIGPQLNRFPNAAAFASWLALCPANNKSGGKVLSSKTRQTNSRASRALRLAAQTLARSRSHLGSFYRRMRARLGAPQAITAAAHKLARIIYHMLATGQAYDETIFLEEDRKQAQRHEKRLRKQANAIGFQLVPIAA